jgi:hypothetical protein
MLMRPGQRFIRTLRGGGLLRLCYSVLCVAAGASRAETAAPPITAPPSLAGPAVSAATTPTTSKTRSPSPSEELNTLLMHATFLVTGPTKVQNEISFGPVFIMGIPQKSNPKLAHIVMVTAAHVFEGISGDIAMLQLRRPGPNGTYAPLSFQLPIRRDGKPLYVKHSVADVVAMYANIPDVVPLTGLPPDALLTDKTREDIEFHPGDEAFILGFPAMVSIEGGFPILRTGRIASYPLTPMNVVKEWAFDAHVFGGNNGGPVYFTSVNRFFKNQIYFGVASGLLGLVSKETQSRHPKFVSRDLNYGIVVPSKFIRETIDMLPPPSSEPNGPTPPDATGTLK